MAVVEVRNLVKEYDGGPALGRRRGHGTVRAIDGIDLATEEGEYLVLLGPSGCGKTTLLRCFNRVNERYTYVRTSGEIQILGQNIYAPEVSLIELRKAVGMVFQRPNPLPLSVYENVVFGLRVHAEGAALKRSSLDETVERALTQVGLWKDLKDRLHSSATSLKPEVILMDEPCSALDVQGTRAIEELMFVLKEHFTLVVVTHNMAQARRVSDECIFMLLGKLIEHDNTADLFLNPKHPQTADYIEGRYG
jgi:phosphate transport system ATP-binding protein